MMIMNDEFKGSFAEARGQFGRMTWSRNEYKHIEIQ